MMTPDQILSALQWRYATKAFDASQTVPAATWAAIEQSLLLTPSSFGLQPWKFLVVTDKKVREELVSHSWGQRQVADCSHLVIMAVKKEITVADIDAFLASTVEQRGGTVEALSGYRDVIIGSHSQGYMSTDWAKKQAYIALGQLMTVCAALRIDACPMEGFLSQKYDEVLGLDKAGYTAAVLCPVGYRAESDKYATLPKVRYTAEQLIQRV
jgi:nitroreductase